MDFLKIKIRNNKKTTKKRLKLFHLFAFLYYNWYSAKATNCVFKNRKELDGFTPLKLMKRKVIKLFLMGIATASVVTPAITNSMWAAEVSASTIENSMNGTETFSAPEEESSSSKLSSEESSSEESSTSSLEESSESSKEEQIEPSVLTIRTYNKTSEEGEDDASVKIIDRRSGNTANFERNSKGVYTYNDDGNYRYLEPDSSGYIKVYGLNGSYTVEDSGSSSDIYCETSYKDFSIYDGDEDSVQINYVKNYGSISLQVSSEDGSAVSEATFVLKDSGGSRIRFSRNNGLYEYANSGGSEDIVTNAAGTATLDKLPIGTYTLEQISAPVDYNGEMVTKTISVESQKKTSLSVVNTKQYGDLSVHVVDSSDNSVVLSGSEYYVKDVNGNFIYLVKNSDGVYSFSRSSTEYTAKTASGDLTINGLPKGSYTLVEATAPTGFKAASVKAFDISKDSKTNVRITNDRATGSMVVYITDDTTGEPIKGFEYQLIRKDNDQIVSVRETEGGFIYATAGSETVMTDEEGKIQVTGIPTGTYLLKQVSAAEGYLIDIDAIEQIVDTDAETVFNTTASKSNSAVFVTNNDGEPVAGVAFNILDENGEVILSDVTNENGKFLISGIIAGNYSLVVTGVPEFYSFYTSIVPFSIDETGMSEGLGKIVLKYSEIKMNFGVQDLEVFMMNKADNSVISVTTDADGVAVFSKVAFGEYEIYLEEEGVDFQPIEVVVNETFESLDMNVEFSSSSTEESMSEEGEEPSAVVTKKVNNGVLIAILAAIVAAGFGGYMYYEKIWKKKKTKDVSDPNQFISYDENGNLIGYDKDGNQIVYEIEDENQEIVEDTESEEIHEELPEDDLLEYASDGFDEPEEDLEELSFNEEKDETIKEDSKV